MIPTLSTSPPPPAMPLPADGGYVTPGLWRRIYRSWVSYALLLPTFILLFVFSYYPAVRGILYAFQEVNPGVSQSWIGLDNFRKMLSDQLLWWSFGNLLILLAGNLLKSIILPLFVAVLIARLASSRLRYGWQTLFLFPIVVPGMVGILLWRGFIYDYNMGLINQVLGLVGLDSWRMAWLGEHSTALASLIFVGFPWVGGIGFLIFLAGLLGISQSVTESARLDGATAFRRFWSIELPLIMGQIKLVVVLTLIGTIQDFGLILVMTQGGPGTATLVPAYHMYLYAFRFDQFGYGAAIGVVLFVIIMLATIANMKLIKSAESE